MQGLKASTLRPAGGIRPMSALGQKQTCAAHKPMSALPPKATEIADIVDPQKGRALLLCPLVSDVDLLRYGEGIVHIDAEIPDQAEEILSYEISDEALESAAGNKRAATYTLFYCTALDLCPGP